MGRNDKKHKRHKKGCFLASLVLLVFLSLFRRTPVCRLSIQVLACTAAETEPYRPNDAAKFPATSIENDNVKYWLKRRDQCVAFLCLACHSWLFFLYCTPDPA